jgi:hypothetical protein
MDPNVRAEFDELRAAHRRAMERMDRADKRMEKFDAQLQATRKLVEAGIKMVRGLAADTRELKRSQKAFLDSFRNGRNGHSDKS